MSEIFASVMTLVLGGLVGIALMRAQMAGALKIAIGLGSIVAVAFLGARIGSQEMWDDGARTATRMLDETPGAGKIVVAPFAGITWGLAGFLGVMQAIIWFVMGGLIWALGLSLGGLIGAWSKARSVEGEP